MKTPFKSIISGSAILVALLLFSQACKKDMVPGDPAASAANNTASFIEKSIASYMQVNLTADVSDYNPIHIDSNLVNAWGMSFGPTGGIWVSANETSVSVIYNKQGSTLFGPVFIPFENGSSNPTGQVRNRTSSFIISSTSERSKFIFATENGSIAAWASGTSAITVADRSAQGAVYKGIEMARNSTGWFLFATDFHNGNVDVFDHNFNFVSSSMFVDPNMPAGFAPFNIRKLAGKLYVTYAMQLAPENHDDQAGPGNGYVDIFNTNGTFVHRFASQGQLNSPWGLEVLRGSISNENEQGDDDDQGNENDQGENEDSQHPIILVGNFGDGHINAFDHHGNFISALMSNSAPVVIDGLWSISYPPQENEAYESVHNRLYFTAGPAHESHGIFGYLKK